MVYRGRTAVFGDRRAAVSHRSVSALQRFAGGPCCWRHPSGQSGSSPTDLVDRSRQPLLLAAVLMLIGALQAETGALAWAGSAIGCSIWAFWALQPYVLTEQQRRDAAWMLVVKSCRCWSPVSGRCCSAGRAPGGWGRRTSGSLPRRQAHGRLSGCSITPTWSAWLGVVWPLMLRSGCGSMAGGAVGQRWRWCWRPLARCCSPSREMRWVVSPRSAAGDRPGPLDRLLPVMLLAASSAAVAASTPAGVRRGLRRCCRTDPGAVLEKRETAWNTRLGQWGWRHPVGGGPALVGLGQRPSA